MTSVPIENVSFHDERVSLAIGALSAQDRTPNGQREEDVTTAWIRNRSTITHDWLSGKHFIGRLLLWQRIVEGQVDKSALDTIDFRKLAVEWAEGQASITWLIDNFEAALSPRTLIEKGVLLHLPVSQRQCIGALIHQLWLTREHVHDLITEAKAAIAAADRQFRAVSADDAAGERACRSASLEQISSLLSAIRRLRDAVSRLPSRIRVT